MAYKEQDFRNWIDSGESAYGRVKAIYEKAREYVENDQAPGTIPKGKEYVKYNIITAAVRRAVGELVSSKMTPTLLGGGQMTEVLRELFNDILEENMFWEKVMPSAANFFYTEGYSGLKFVDNPNKLSKYGVGKPEIYWLRPDELWLDGNSRDGFHNDDIFRIHPKRITLDAALANPKWEAHRDAITESTRQKEYDASDIKFVDLYEIEYRVTEYDKYQLPDGSYTDVEKEVFYMTKFINKTVQVEKPVKTGYPTFRMIPLIHTPRSASKYGKYPFGMYELMAQGQDLLNIGYSVVLDTVKASIKQAVLARGVTPEEQAEHKKELAKTNAYIATRSPNARVEIIQGPPIAPSLTQFLNDMRFMVDEITARYSPDRGQVQGELSGRAIQSLQAAGAVPELTAQKHIELALTNLGTCIFHYIRSRMAGQPFMITREVNGEQVQIPFNGSSEMNAESTPLSVVRNGYVNDLRQIPDNARMKIDVDLNPIAKQDFNMNVALLLRERGDLSLMDELKAVYPNSWQEKMENTMKENQAMALVQDMAATSPEAVDQISQIWQQIKPKLVAQEKALKGASNGAI